MALGNSDGSIVLSVDINDSELDSGLSDIEQKVKGLGKVLDGVAIGVGTALGKVVKDSVEAFSEFEQLEGGAKKIFDEMDYSRIAQDATNAYSEMQISAKDYLEMMNSVGATFSQTLGDTEGYEAARRGMQAISDYATGTGRDINQLSEKFQLITRSTSSYQSICDQFAGLLPQTTEDFLKQAQAAGDLSSEYTSLTEVPVAEYQQAVTNALERGVEKMGLAGNAAAEASDTISGSVNKMKSSWQNLLVAFSSGEGEGIGIDKAMDSLIESIKDVISNVLPRLKQAFSSVLDQVPFSVKAIASAFIAAKVAILAYNAAMAAKKTAEVAATVATKAAAFAQSIFNGTLTVNPIVAVTFAITALGIALVAIVANWDDVSAAASSAWEAIKSGASTVKEAVTTAVQDWFSGLQQLFQGVVENTGSKFQEIKENVTSLGEAIGEIIGNIDFEGIGESISEFVGNAGTKISEFFGNIDFEGIIGNISEFAKNAVDKIGEIIGSIDFQAIADGIADFTQNAISKIGEIWNGVGESIENALGKVKEVIGNIGSAMEEIFGKIGQNASQLPEMIRNTMSQISNLIQRAFSSVDIGGVFKGWDESLKSIWGDAVDWITRTLDSIRKAFGSVGDAISNIFSGAARAINSVIDRVDNLLSKLSGVNNATSGIANSVSQGEKKTRSASLMSAEEEIDAEIPKLAKGAVIPPNRQFLALLGDQRNGTNIEAPLETIKQAVREEMGNTQSTGDIVIPLMLNETQFGKAVVTAFDIEQRRKTGAKTKLLI